MAVFFVLLFPFIIKAYLYYPSNEKKVYFSLCVYNIRIFGGEIERNGANLSIFCFKRKHYIVPIKKAFLTKAKFKPLKDYKLYKISSFISIGVKENMPQFLGVGGVICTLLEFINFYNYQHRARLFIDNKILYKLDSDDFSISIGAICFVNMLMLAISLAKVILGRIFNGKQKR